MIVVKVNGEGSDALLDRDSEVFNMVVAHSAGLTSPIYARSVTMT